MASLDLLDTPRRVSLSTRTTSLRASIKTWERSFAASHDGRKPRKSDIKANLDIAAKYKEFQKLGDVLAGKLGVDALKSPPTKQKPDPTRRRLYDLTPRKTREDAVFDVHPSEAEPYDVPHSATPKRFLHAIGPTPQRDGKVLGLFDLLSNSGGTGGSKNTPESCDKKRKVDALLETHTNVVAQTPSRKKVATEGDLLQHLAPSNQMHRSGGKRFGRTPASESKKFMLSQFFATPSTMRYANLVEDNECVNVEKTPLRNLVLGLGSAERQRDINEGIQDATPVFLRRTYSFKDRLVSALNDQATSMMDNMTSPSASRRGPPTLRRYKSVPKPLSQIVRDLQEVREQRHHDDHADDDDLEAMKEMEDEAQIQNSQPQELSDFEGQGESDLDDARPEPEKEKLWKKKGQKRTTKRSNMRPVTVRRAKAPKFVAAEESEDELSRFNETQFLGTIDGTASLPYENVSDDEVPGLEDISATEPARGEDQDFEGDFQPDNDEDTAGHVDETLKKRRKAQPTTNLNEPHAFKPKKSSKVAKINPNAISHQNFKTLKIRGKNSKGKSSGAGRGKFGRRR